MNEQKEIQENPYKEFYIKAQESHIGELLGKVIDLEAKNALLTMTNQAIGEKLTELSSTGENNVSLQQRIQIIESNLKAFEEQNNQLKADLKIAREDRQLAQEELGKVIEINSNKKRGRPKNNG